MHAIGARWLSFRVHMGICETEEGFRVSGDSLWGVTTSHGEHIMIIGCGARPGLPEDDMGQRALVSAVPPTVRWR